MPYMIHAQVVKYHHVPIITSQLFIDVSGDIVINLKAIETILYLVPLMTTLGQN